ncbi:MAG: tripartite tricarboxylate transporter substrate binding protein [Betaproteobacteria bacterium]|jgi:tripartite-type tricarboxylate transporter receptor subunit TctC
MGNIPGLSGVHAAGLAMCLACLAGAGLAHAQAYPAKPIRIVTTVPGGSLDLTARIIAPKLTERLGQNVIVDNRGGVLSMEIVAKSPPDGYTLLLASASLWTSHFLRDNVAWDALRDYAPVSQLVTSPNFLVVHPSLPVKTVTQLIALARSRSGELNYSSGQTGSSSHVAGELFNQMAGVNVVRVAYKGQGPSMVALITGETQISFPNAAAATPFVKSGRIRALAVTTAAPSAFAPGLPTVAASGLPGYESRAVLGLFVPVRTPPALIELLNAEVNRALGLPDVRQQLFESGAEASPGSPAELAAFIKADMALTGKVMRRTAQ